MAAATMTFADDSYPSICLPFVHKSVGWKHIKEVVQSAGLGLVDRVDVASKKGPKPFNIVFVHFKSWNDTHEINHLRTNLHTNNKFFGKLDCDDQGHYWKFTKSHVARPQRDTTKSTVESIDDLLRKEYAALANIQKRIADLQARRSTLMLEHAATAVPTADFPPMKTATPTTTSKTRKTKRSGKRKLKTIKLTNVFATEDKPRAVKPIRIPVTHEHTAFPAPSAGGTPPITPPFATHAGGATPPIPPPFGAPESPVSWADVVEREESA